MAPAVFVDDIAERDTADWPKPAHRVAMGSKVQEWTFGGNPSAAFASFPNGKYNGRQSRSEAEGLAIF